MCSVGQSFYFVVEEMIVLVEICFGVVSFDCMFCDCSVYFGCCFDVVFVVVDVFF